MKLLNLFKKEAILNKENIMNELPASVSSKIYPIEVQQIHHEFNSAADNLLLEAKSIIEEARVKNVSKVNRLELLGFKQASQVTELKPLMEKADLSEEQLKSLAYFQQNYPLNKFITEEQVKIICHKYNLVCGEVSRFKGFVPEKNLSDIEKFKLKKEDITVTGYVYGVSNGKPYYLTINKSVWDKVESKYGSENLSLDDNWCHGKAIGINANYFDRVTYSKLQICAPIKDMDIKDLELKEGYKLTKKHIPDPVILQPVKNGYLIITAWGDEASDPLVVNQLNN